jgi:hypothetical protein
VEGDFSLKDPQDEVLAKMHSHNPFFLLCHIRRDSRVSGASPKFTRPSRKAPKIYHFPPHSNSTTCVYTSEPMRLRKWQLQNAPTPPTQKTYHHLQRQTPTAGAGSIHPLNFARTVLSIQTLKNGFSFLRKNSQMEKRHFPKHLSLDTTKLGRAILVAL